MTKLKDRGLSPLFVVVTLIIMAIVLPSVFIFVRLVHPVTESWLHIKEYVLAEYIKNSLVLVVGVSMITGVFGTFFAWSLSKYKWKYSLLLESLLFLPMAIPPYIAGYVYGGIFTPFGTLDRIFDKIRVEGFRIDILSTGGAIFVFSLFLMPYVLLVTKGFFEKLPKTIEESSRLLGRGPLETFIRVILPMARGALVGGIVLVMLEVLNDYGLVRYFGIPTFSTAIYQTWFGTIMFNTISVGLIVTVLVVIAGVLIGNLNRLRPGILSKVYARIVILGYSIPASIIAIGVFVTFISIDRGFGGLYDMLNLKNLFLSSSKFILIFALAIRFMAIGFNNIESGFSKMGKKYYEASKLLGRGEWHTFRYVDFPIFKPAIISAGILAFVDVLKELPLTLILRPFSFDTLATRVYTYAGDEMIHEASVYSLMIIGVSVIALIALRFIRKGSRT